VIAVQPVILAGGGGTRLWPLSRALYPKQFLALSGPQTLFQQTMLRASGIRAEDWVLRGSCVIANEEHRFMVLDQLRELGVDDAQLVLEPEGRNTAPALTLAALCANSVNDSSEDPVLVVMSADHVIGDQAAFFAAIEHAIRAAQDGGVMVLGVPPKSPETGYGYIRAEGSSAVRKVLQFVEKPALEQATQYVESGDYYWNSGIFILRASIWLKLIGEFRPDILGATEQAWAEKKVDGHFLRPGAAAFRKISSDSIDYAVMERCPARPDLGVSVGMVSLDAGWSDLGAWEAVWQIAEKDDCGNVARGDVFLEGCTGTLVEASHRLVAVVGLSDIVVVETPDAVLVATREASQEVKKIVNWIKGQSRSEATVHRRVHRPWGWYDGLDADQRFQVKRIMVKPGASLSLQKHHHRAEHWIVVSGTAEVTRGEKKFLLTENQSTYIPLGEIHSLKNPGSIPLEIIEVQSGSYLGEDDIVRIQDIYGRK
jgi:mannose-1-phosphate guanylyltransferase/mannose-6-phosphate isomerase